MRRARPPGLFSIRILKLAEPMGAAPTLYLARQASVNAV